ncbi:regulatory protein, Fis family [Desulfonauticus submarinus]|uniref:Regulatory protein, Fis family n=1 Tax=Desulfonauticus submarinus TaxID=206665 RepID=A0A1H0ERH9_9BACT|nr:sigma-54 dependent transcriptional regulator [Desulfonauticus submarinus]SDN84961.1 regulatory protein, Fis family [Desulfonauticus submarinus]
MNFNPYGILGNSPALQEVFKILEKVAPTDTTVLVTGESGTGKELLVRALHKNSQRKNKPFVPVNCGAIPKELLESELFGHEKGAFTHAIRSRAGRFEVANGGTIFLDEIGELDLSLQVKILRVIQEKEFERVGSNKTQKVDVRIVAATNKNLEEEVDKGNFREDLFYRLNVIPIHLPPLRKRGSDILLLANYFLKKFCTEKNREPLTLTSEVENLLLNYSWPGNVRELENFMERISILCEGTEVKIQDLPEKIIKTSKTSPSQKKQFLFPSLADMHNLNLNLKDFLEEIENKLILDALKKSNGVKNKAAELLGIKRTTLIEKIKKKKL